MGGAPPKPPKPPKSNSGSPESLLQKRTCFVISDIKLPSLLHVCVELSQKLAQARSSLTLWTVGSVGCRQISTSGLPECTIASNYFENRWGEAVNSGAVTINIYLSIYNIYIYIQKWVCKREPNLGQRWRFCFWRPFESPQTRLKKPRIHTTSFDRLSGSLGKGTWRNAPQHAVLRLLFCLGGDCSTTPILLPPTRSSREVRIKVPLFFPEALRRVLLLKAAANFTCQLLMPTCRELLHLPTSHANLSRVTSPANFSCQLVESYFTC